MMVTFLVIHKRDEPIDILLFNRDNNSAVPFNPEILSPDPCTGLLLPAQSTPITGQRSYDYIYLFATNEALSLSLSARGERSKSFVNCS